MTHTKCDSVKLLLRPPPHVDSMANTIICCPFLSREEKCVTCGARMNSTKGVSGFRMLSYSIHKNDLQYSVIHNACYNDWGPTKAAEFLKILAAFTNATMANTNSAHVP